MRCCLLIDADDTLWENNVYFEAAISEFLDFVESARYSRSEMRAILDGIEHAHRSTRGYGVESFGLNLLDAFRCLSDTPPTAARLAWIEGLAKRIADHDVELIDGVRETLEYLSLRHRLILLTKGKPKEQHKKIQASGLRPLFDSVEIVEEKNLSAYQRVVETYALQPAETWMVGNSPRSDINPALAAGLNAVFIPHDRTWSLEHEHLATGPGKLYAIDKFSQLRDYF